MAAASSTVSFVFSWQGSYTFKGKDCESICCSCGAAVFVGIINSKLPPLNSQELDTLSLSGRVTRDFTLPLKLAQEMELAVQVVGSKFPLEEVPVKILDRPNFKPNSTYRIHVRPKGEGFVASIRIPVKDWVLTESSVAK